MRHLHGKRVLITGAGHGIGRAVARAFAAEGCDVVVTDRDAEGVRETSEILQHLGYPAAGFPMDVTSPQEVRHVRAQLHAEDLPIDILVNNAGIVNGGRFLDVPLDRHLQTFDVNIRGAVVVTHAFLPDLVARPEAHLVNIASAAGMVSLPFAASYASSKWAMIGFSESLLEELRLEGRRHVHVTTVCPSYVATGMFAGVRTPRFTRKLTPERLARLIVSAVIHDREQILAPWLARVIPAARGLLPRRMLRLVSDWLGISNGMASWQGHGAAVPSATPPPIGLRRLPSPTEPSGSSLPVE